MKFYNPENFKQGELLLSRYYPKELAVLLLSIIVSVGLTILVGTATIGSGNPLLLSLLFILAIVPAGLAFFLLNPLEGYHNAYYFLKLKAMNKKTQKDFMWEGVQYDDSDESV